MITCLWKETFCSTSHTPEDVKVMDKSVDDDYLEDNDEYEGLAALLI